jgi:hypothetical protein
MKTKMKTCQQCGNKGYKYFYEDILYFGCNFCGLTTPLRYRISNQGRIINQTNTKKIMLKKTRRLIMYNSSEIEFEEKKAGKKTGETIKKWKYEFFDKDGNLFVGYDETGNLASSVNDIEDLVWDEALAKDYTFQIKLWDGKKTEQLLAE